LAAGDSEDTVGLIALYSAAHVLVYSVRESFGTSVWNSGLGFSAYCALGMRNSGLTRMSDPAFPPAVWLPITTAGSARRPVSSLR
jgi:hypothetical protein